MLFHTRDLLVRQRTQTINALRGHLAEYGVVAPQGRARIRDLAGVLEDGDCGLPEAVVELGTRPSQNRSLSAGTYAVDRKSTRDWGWCDLRQVACRGVRKCLQALSTN